MSRPQFFLKAKTLDGEASPSAYDGLYLRLHGGGIDSVLLMPTPPVYIKAHEDGERISFTSSSHEGRRWGLSLRIDGGQRAGWEKVEIVENGGTEGLRFSKSTDSSHPEILVCVMEEAGENLWKGWMVCDWASGHPQLFWVTDKLKGVLPPFCQRVQIVREML